MKTSTSLIALLSLTSALATPLVKRISTTDEITQQIAGWAGDVDDVNNFLDTAAGLSAADVLNLANAVLSVNVMDEPKRLSFLCGDTSSFSAAGVAACANLPGNFAAVPAGFMTIINGGGSAASVATGVQSINNARYVPQL
ncbi:hypothetical protein BT63DRAFT_427066, partial [Microthyrium microscopicum]